MENLAHVLWYDEIALPHKSACTRHAGKRQNATRAYAQLNHLELTRALAQMNDIVEHGIGNKHVAHVILDLNQIVPRYFRLNVVERIVVSLDLQNSYLVFRRRITQRKTNHKAVELAVGQGLRANRTHRVFGGNANKRLGDGTSNAIDGNRMLLHNFKQRRLRFGTCTVDFVA